MNTLQFPAQIVSLLLHPIFMPLLGVYLMLSADTEIAEFTHERTRKGMFMLLAVLVIAPAISTLVLYSFRFVKDIEMRSNRERLAPFFSTLIFYIMAYVMLSRAKHLIHPAFFASFSAALAAMGMGFLLTFRYRISMHAMGVAGVAGMLYAMIETVFFSQIWMVAIFIFLTGLVGAARMIRSVHTLDQILVGALLGFASQYAFLRYGIIF